MTMRIAAEQLCVDYNGTVALYDASLKLPSGCICGLVGMNGAGKSTLFKALTGFIRPSRGRIRITLLDGDDGFPGTEPLHDATDVLRNRHTEERFIAGLVQITPFHGRLPFEDASSRIAS